MKTLILFTNKVLLIKNLADEFLSVVEESEKLYNFEEYLEYSVNLGSNDEKKAANNRCISKLLKSMIRIDRIDGESWWLKDDWIFDYSVTRI